ncbi:MAG TPA: energy-coupling factor transporter transmembrane protein EcfT [Clostridia bacterium]|nr:energy-coupling factor transporter transmembrane protein EcfT [Clostridia bacterium]
MSLSPNPVQNKKKPPETEFFPGLTYMDSSSLVHHLHPLVKLVWLISFSLTVFAISSPAGEIILFCLLLVSYGVAGLGVTFFSRKLRFILIFGLSIFLIQILFVKEGFLLWQFCWDSICLEVWSEGFWGGLEMMLRFINIIASSYLFVATTDPNRLAYALMQAGLPYRFGFMLIAALRFIPVFQLELAQVRNAQMAKGIDMEGFSPGKLLRVIKYLLVPLVISTLSKVDTLTISMESRAFGLYPDRTYLHSQALSVNDKVAILAVPLLFLVFYLIISV